MNVTHLKLIFYNTLPTQDQIFKYLNLWETFSFKPPQCPPNQKDLFSTGLVNRLYHHEEDSNLQR